MTACNVLYVVNDCNRRVIIEEGMKRLEAEDNIHAELAAWTALRRRFPFPCVLVELQAVEIVNPLGVQA